MIELALYARLVGAVGGIVHPVRASEGVTGSHVTYTLISSTPFNHLDGPATLDRLRYQVDVWSPSYATAVAMAETIRAALEGYSDLAADWQGTMLESTSISFDNSASPFFYRVSSDYMAFGQRPATGG